MTTHPAHPSRTLGIVQPEVRTRRLVVIDDQGSPRITGEVVDGTAEFRLELPENAADQASVVLYANQGDEDIEPNVGVQLWAAGNAYLELNLWRRGNGWVASTHVAAKAGAESGAQAEPE